MKQLAWLNLAGLSFAGGIYLAAQADWTVAFICVGLLALVNAAAFIVVWPQRRTLQLISAVLLVFVLAGGMRLAVRLWTEETGLGEYTGQFVELTGQLDEEARVFDEAAGGQRVYYTLAVQSLKYGGKVYPADGLVEVSCRTDSADIGRYGDTLTAYGRLREIDFYKNPGQLNRRAMKERQGIIAKMASRSIKLTASEGWLFKRELGELRRHIRQAMARSMQPDDAAALFAMLFGGYGGISPEMLEAFSITGIIHILSVSGSHITLLAGTMEKLGRMLKLPLAGRLTLIFLAVLSYSAVAGFVPPVVRSAFMGLTVFAAEALGRRSDARLALMYIALLMLIYQPQLVFDISFELSFLATAGLLYLAPSLTARLQAVLPHWLAVSIAVTAAAQLASLPVLAWYFNAVSLSALAANLLLVPLIEYLIILSLAAVLLGLIFPLAMQLLLALAGMLLGFVAVGARLLSHLPLAQCFVPAAGICVSLLYYAILLAVFKLDSRCLTPTTKLATVLTALLIFRLTLLWPQEPELHFIDVGQGDAALLLTKHHRAVLVDTGGLLNSDFDVGERVLLPYLRHYGVQKLDYLLLTHAHADHAGGAGAVLRRLPVAHIITASEAAAEYETVMKLRVGSLAGRLNIAVAGQTIWLDGVRLEVLWAGSKTQPKAGGNELSNVYRLTAGEHSCLITGDLDAVGEAAMLRMGIVEPVDILKVAHHGSKTSSTKAFLAAAAPKYAVISVGSNNNFGHPTAEVLERLTQVGANIYRTDINGAVVFRLSEDKITAAVYQNGRD